MVIIKFVGGVIETEKAEISQLQPGIWWDTEKKVIYFDINEHSTSFQKKIILKQDSRGKIEMVNHTRILDGVNL